jgi:hypothetical protein
MDFKSISHEMEQIDEREAVVGKIKDVIVRVTENWKSLGIEDLLNAEITLARYSETLGELTADLVAEMNYQYAYRKFQYATHWSETKERLAREFGEKGSKPTQGDIDADVEQQIWERRAQEILAQNKADKYKALIDAVGNVLLAITHKLRELERQTKLTTNTAS